MDEQKQIRDEQMRAGDDQKQDRDAQKPGEQKQDRDAQKQIGKVRSAVISGVAARLVLVEVHRGPGLPRQTIVGLPGGAVRESLERIHAACGQSGMRLRPRRTTINLAPAGVRKRGSGLDLPIALALLAADGTIDPAAIADTLCLGELALDGRVRPVPGVLPAVLAARAIGITRALVPEDNGPEAAAVPEIDTRVVGSLKAAVEYARGERDLDLAAAAPYRHEETRLSDLADVRGHLLARRAIEVAAAGGHHLLMSGPPGSGKTLLARSLPGLLPALGFDEAIEVSSVHSVIGGLSAGLMRQRPFRAPHHTVTTPGLVGGGAPLRPGEISLATRGVLFLDELPEFSRAALESLRQPLEEGAVAISRANESHRFPSRFQLVAAMNECPCGRGPADHACMCTETEVARYWKRVSGPLLDRIDLFIPVERLPLVRLTEPAGNTESSLEVSERVAAARSLQQARNPSLLAASAGTKSDRTAFARTPSTETMLAGTMPAGTAPDWLNAALPPRSLMEACALPASLLDQTREAAEGLELSARAWYRLLRVARTCADLAGRDTVAEADLHEALQYRRPVTDAA